MTFLRFAGCALILLSCALGCASYSDFLSKRLNALENTAAFFAEIRRQIEYYRTPFPQILREIAAKDNTNPDNIETELCRFLDVEDRQRFSEYYGRIGSGFADTEIGMLSEAVEYFTERVGICREEFSRKKRVGTSLAFFFAASVCIMII